MEAPAGPPSFVKLSLVVQRTMERAYGALAAVIASSANKSDKERKQLLYEWFVRTRASVIRLLVVLKWARTVPDINHTRDILSFLATQDGLFVSTADNLYTLHQRLQLVKVPIYDVPTAIDVLSSGSYTRLPTSIAAVAGLITPVAPKQIELKRRVEDMLHYRLFFSVTPPQYSDIRIENDRVVLSVVGEFKVSLTADGEALDKYPWRIVDISVYVGSESEGQVQLPQSIFAFLKDLLTQRLPVAAQPLSELYSILHSFCLSLQLELLYSQTANLVRGPWQDALWPLYVKDQSLSLHFWTPLPKVGQPAEDAPCVQVRLDQDRALLVTLFPPAPLADPIRLPRPLQAERLLLSAIAAQSLQRLSVLRASLLNDVEAALKAADVNLVSLLTNAGPWHTLVIGLGFSKQLTVSVDGKSGRYVAHLPPMSDPAPVTPAAASDQLNRSAAHSISLVTALIQQTLVDVFAQLISVYYSSELVRVSGLSVDGYEVPPRALVHRYADVEHSFVIIDVSRKGRVTCTAVTTAPVDGARLPRKVEEHTSELDLRDASQLMQERCRRALATALAAAQWARASRQVLTRFLEAHSLRFTVPAPDRVVLSALPEAEHFMPRLISFAALEGVWELRITEGERLLRRPHIESGNGLKYHGGIWTFPVARLSVSCLEELLKCVKSFGRLLRVAALMESTLDAAPNAALAAAFKGPVVYPGAVHLQHIVGDTVESTVSITWRDEAYQLNFGDLQHPLAAFFQAQLNSQVCDARALLEGIEYSLVPSRVLLKFVQPQERTPQSPAPGDFTLLPHASSQVRVVYRSTFGLDFTFLPGGVAVEDAVKPTVRVVSTSLSAVTQLAPLLEKMATRTHGRLVVPLTSLPAALHSIYRLLGALLFLRRIQHLCHDIDPQPKLDAQAHRCRLTLRSGQALVFHLHDHTLEFSATAPGLPPSAPVADGISAEDIEALAAFSRANVACEPYRLQSFSSFLHLLYLGNETLRQFVRVIAAIERRELQGFQLLMAIPSSTPQPGPTVGSHSVLVDKPTGDVRFAVRLRPGTAQEQDVLLRWSPSTSRLSLWLSERVLNELEAGPLLEQLRALAHLPAESLRR